MSRFNAVDLSQLAPPPVVEVLDYEDILAALVADFITRFPDYDVEGLESDPAKKVLEVAAYREMVLRQRVNDAAQAVMVATSLGGDLEHLGALFGVTRAIVSPGNPNAVPPVPPTLEDDDRLRERIQLSIEAYSTAGPYGAYTFYGMTASGQVRDVAVYGPESALVDPGQVGVWVLAQDGDGTASPALVATVQAAFDDKERRPLTDQVIVAAAAIETYAVAMQLEVPPGPDHEVIRQAAVAKVAAYVASRRRIGAKVSTAGISGAGFVAGVTDVTLTSPAADVVPGPTAAGYCTSITITVVEAE